MPVARDGFPSLSKGKTVKKLVTMSLVLSLAAVGVLSAADSLKSGPQEGDSLGAFYVTKAAGAAEDGVDEGRNLCYRCRNGSRPQVIVFTRSSDPKVANFIKQLDQEVAKNQDYSLRAFVNLLGEDKAALKSQAKKLAAKTEAKNVPFVVPNEAENGPDNYGLNPKASVTVVLASDLGVKASHAVRNVEELDVNAVIADISKILN